MKAPTLVLAAFVAALCSSELLSTAQAVSTTVIKKNCIDTKTCYRGGVKANPCTISAAACPPCVVFDSSNGCYELTNGACTFGFDCTTYWDAAASAGSGSGSGKSGSTGTAGNPGSTSTGTNSTAKPSTSARSSSGSAGGAGGGGAGTAGSGATDDGNDMSAIFAIIGATMGVIAVAVIFLTLVRRSRAAHNDDDEEAATPPAMAKDPQSSTAAVTYASYAAGGAAGAATRVRGASSGADTTEAALYYNQKPQNLPMASPRVAGRAVPTVAAPRAQPMANPAPAARAMPVFATKAPLSAAPVSQTQTQQQTIPDPVQMYYQVPAQPVAVAQAPAQARRVSSPRNRRESFEF